MRAYRPRRLHSGTREPSDTVDGFSGLPDASYAMRLVYAVRESNGWTQTELAAELGVSRWTIARWESGRTEPNVRDMPLLRALLNLDIKKPPG